MARRKKMTVDEYIQNRDDMTMLALGQSPAGYEIMLRLDGSYSTIEMAEQQLKFVSKTLGIPIAPHD
jgi:hypothetical protein